MRATTKPHRLTGATDIEEPDAPSRMIPVCDEHLRAADAKHLPAHGHPGAASENSNPKEDPDYHSEVRQSAWSSLSAASAIASDAKSMPTAEITQDGGGQRPLAHGGHTHTECGYRIRACNSGSLWPHCLLAIGLSATWTRPPLSLATAGAGWAAAASRRLVPLTAMPASKLSCTILPALDGHIGVATGTQARARLNHPAWGGGSAAASGRDRRVIIAALDFAIRQVRRTSGAAAKLHVRGVMRLQREAPCRPRWSAGSGKLGGPGRTQGWHGGAA